MSKIYGLFGGAHSASVSLIIDGKIKYCVEEERLTRVKAGHDYGRNPILSLNSVESMSGVNISESDHIMFVEPVPDRYAQSVGGTKYERVSHHDAHCYGAYYTSGMEGKVITVSYDGGGDKSIMKVFLCDEGKMELAYSMDFATMGTLPLLWAFVTSGIKGYDEYGGSIWVMCKDEGKLMGMAPEGRYDEVIYNMLKSVINYDNFRFYPSGTGDKAKFLIDNLRELGYFDTQEKMEIFTYNLQKLTEDLMIRFFNDLHSKFPSYKKLSLSGGLFANVKLNQKINELSWVDEIYVYPAMGDEGLSLGACIYKAVELGEWTKPIKLKNVFFGIKYDDKEIEDISNRYNFKTEIYDPIKVSKYLDSGYIIGWFRDGFEFGPRALGGRSILVRPTNRETHSILNNRLKRNDVMPFAPIVLEEHFEKVFNTPKSKYGAQFMTICYDTKEEWISKIPAVIQKSDNTARPQIVSRESNYEFWEILNEYYKISGIPLLLNTSFNSHNQPIIDKPEHAFELLKSGVVDKLSIGKYVYSA
jgi:carbamoyltransferase